FHIGRGRVLRCAECGLTWREPDRAAVDGAGLIHPLDFARPDSWTERQAAASYCERLRRRQPEACSLLLIADMRHPLHEVAQDSGFQVASFHGPAQFLEGDDCRIKWCWCQGATRSTIAKAGAP